MTTLLITDHYSENTRQTLMTIRENVVLDKSAIFHFTESIPWIRFTLSFDEKTLDKETLMRQMLEQVFVIEEIDE